MSSAEVSVSEIATVASSSVRSFAAVMLTSRARVRLDWTPSVTETVKVSVALVVKALTASASERKR